MPLTFGAERIPKETQMEIETSCFGRIEVAEEQIIEFVEGLIGLPDLRRFALIEDEERAPFQWLQSLENPQLAFVVIEPKWLIPDFEIDAPAELAGSLGISQPAECAALAIVTIPEDPREMTANLKGPVIYNPAIRKAAQVVIDELPLQFRILPETA